MSTVQVRMDFREIVLRDGPLVRTTVELLQVLQDPSDGDGADGFDFLRTLAAALLRFSRALLGPDARDEVVEGFAQVALMHLILQIEGPEGPPES